MRGRLRRAPAFGPHCSQAALERHLRDQKRQEKEMREILEDMRRPYELRVQEGGRPSSAVGMIDLTIKAERSPKVIALPNDKEYRAEAAASRKAGRRHPGRVPHQPRQTTPIARLEGYERIGGTTGSHSSSGPGRNLYQQQESRGADQRLPRGDEDQHRDPGKRDPGLFPPDDLPLPLGQVRGGHRSH